MLALVAEGHSNTGIAYHLSVNVRTVETHTSRIFAKLGLEECAAYHRRVLARPGLPERELLMPQQTFDHDEVRLVMAAPAEKIYDLVADPTRMHEFSPEVVGCTWLDGATEPVVGARFKAKNKFSKAPPSATSA